MKKGFTLISKACDRELGFTLIELLVVISIIGVVLGLSVFGLAGARKSARDAKRKSDLESIRSALEIYRADCNAYPVVLSFPLTGDDSTSSCDSTNVYLEDEPTDPTAPGRAYVYYSDGTTYELCAALEGGAEAEVETITCGPTAACGQEPCNYQVTNP
jgi:general secretion pathway protein G